MAENDIELSVGIKLDEAQFTQEYQSKLSKISQATQTQIQGAMDDISGPAAKQWGTLPFAGMHDQSSGNTIATQAFIASLAHDLQNAGYSGTSYESALINATYRSSMSDPMQRYHRLLSMGLTQQADLTHPDTALGRTIETDYTLMSQPWSRDFIKKGEQGSYIDFAGMRKYAVETAGLGKWIDADGGNTADNFELINDELEKIEDKSNTTNKVFTGWNDTLKSVLGTLTAIGAVAGVAKAFERAYAASEKGTLEAGSTLDKRRAFIGMSALDELRTKVASKSVGLGEDSIKNEIYGMSESIEQYKLFGQGDALPSALLGIFDNLIKSDDPYSAYIKSADEIYGQLKGMDKDQRRQWLMLMNKAGLGSMSSLVGQFLSNPDYAKTYGSPSKLFELESNPFYGTYNKAETMMPNLAKLNESIKASYETIYLSWEGAFGEPFKGWWDKFLKQWFVPELQSIMNKAKKMINPTEDDRQEKEFKTALQQTVDDVAEANNIANTEKISGYWSSAAKKVTYGKQSVVYIPTKDVRNPAGPQNFKKRLKDLNSDEPLAFLKALEVAADPASYEKGAIENNEDTKYFFFRAQRALNWLNESGYYDDLAYGGNGAKNAATLSVLQSYLATTKSAPNEGFGNDILDQYLEQTMLNSPGWQKMIEFFDKYGKYLDEHPEQLVEVKLKFADNFAPYIDAEIERRKVQSASQRQ